MLGYGVSYIDYDLVIDLIISFIVMIWLGSIIWLCVDYDLVIICSYFCCNALVIGYLILVMNWL